MKEHLLKLKEACPTWLANYKRGDKVNFEYVFLNRVVFYPGSGSDGQPVKTFNETQSAHTFIYADYLLSSELLNELLIHEGFRGYHLYDKVYLHNEDLQFHEWPKRFEGMKWHKERIPPYCIMCVFDRDADVPETWGSERFVVFFISMDAMMVYDDLMRVYRMYSDPFAVVLQDHGFGGNYDRFGKGGLLDKIATTTCYRPQYLLVAERTEPWDGYEKVSDEYVTGGMWHTHRFLYKLKDPQVYSVNLHDMQQDKKGED